jgi:hypothetical protein
MVISLIQVDYNMFGVPIQPIPEDKNIPLQGPRVFSASSRRTKDEMERILRFLVAEISAIEGCEIVKNKVGRN